MAAAWFAAPPTKRSRIRKRRNEKRRKRVTNMMIKRGKRRWNRRCRIAQVTVLTPWSSLVMPIMSIL